jgi:hypothetical protein
MAYSLKYVLSLCIISTYLIFNAAAHEWHGEASYLFAPGLWSSEHQAAKYCDSYLATTGELVTSKHGFEVMQGPTTVACNFPEITLRTLLDKKTRTWSDLPYALFNALVTPLARHILDTSNNRYQITISGNAKNNISINPYFLNIFALNFGQMHDMRVLAKTFQDMQNSPLLPDSIILYGVSRGAVAAFNFVACMYDPAQCLKPIKAIILESCFDSLANMTSLSYALSCLLPHYDHHGIAPLNQKILQRFVEVCNTHEIPVLFISSLKDQRVPYKNSLNLYHALKDAGLKKMEFITLENSIHSGYSHDDATDTQHYLQSAHTFYKHSGVPYIPDFVA